MNDISIGYIFGIILRRLWIIILCGILFGSATFGYCTFFAQPVYKATASIIITNGALITSKSTSSTETGSQSTESEKDNTVQNTDINASLSLVYSCVDVLKTDDIYRQISEIDGIDYTAAQLMDMFTIEYRSKDSLFIDISVKANKKQDAITLVNTFAEASPAYIEGIIGNTKIRVMSNSDNATKIAPRNVYATAIAAFLGAVLSLIIVFIVEISDKSIKGPDDITNNYDVPFLGTVPSFENALSGGYSYGKYGSYGIEQTNERK